MGVGLGASQTARSLDILSLGFVLGFEAIDFCSGISKESCLL